MTIKIGEDTYVHSVFFAGGGGTDFLGVVYRNDKAWEAKYRIRYDAQTGNDDDDEKSWFTIHPKAHNKSTGKRLAEGLRDVLNAAQKAGVCGEITEIFVDGGPEALGEAMERQPWTKMREITPNEAEKIK